MVARRTLHGRPRDWLLGGLLLAALIVWVDRTIGWGALLAPWRMLAPADLAALVALSLLSYVARAVRVYDYLHAVVGGQFFATLRLSILHNAANNLLPMRIGEAAFPLLMRRYFGHTLTDSALSLVWLRLMDLHLLALIALAALALRAPDPLWWPLAAGVALAPPLMVAWARRSSRWPRRGRIGAFAARALANLPRSGARLARAYLWTLATWLTKFVAFVGVFVHFLPVATWQAMVGILGGELSSVLPFHGIAGSGSYELAVVAALLPFGVDATAVLAAAVNLHLFLLSVTLLLALAGPLLPRGRGPQSTG